MLGDGERGELIDEIEVGLRLLGSSHPAETRRARRA
jgi:hypothetical protein